MPNVEKIVVVDYGMGNLHSVYSALVQVADSRVSIQISHDVDAIENADKIVFPGQGAAADCMHAISSLGLQQTVIDAAKEKPFLGICMGMQVLLDHSDENGGTPCLGMYSGAVRNFSADFDAGQQQELKVPHMGWNTINHLVDHPLWAGIPQNSYFYFVHSYYVAVNDQGIIAGMTDYGIEFASVIAGDKVFAMQCHPEKSADNGLKLLKNFLNWNGN